MNYVYSFMCFILPSVVWQIINRDKLKKNLVKHIIWSYVFIIYCYLVVEVAADMGTLWDLLHNRSIIGQVYLKPLIVNELRSHVLNIIMFVPLGFLLPCIWNEFRNVFEVLKIGFFLSLVIEVSQMFCYRVTDVNDLITNTTGAIVGYGIWEFMQGVFGTRKKRDNMITKEEAIVYIFGGTCGIFMLYSRRLFT
ncbi:MAG: VanZ family protein [Clostridiales bacterium]|nr:VanZ family protein [Clostridiales bacterium]